MVRVGNDMLCDTLKRGKIANEIVVYGFVASHKHERCLPMKYTVDFSNNCNLIEVGEEAEFYKLFSFITLSL